VRAAAWFDRGLDTFAWFALLGFVVASVGTAQVSADFFAGASVLLVILLGWWAYRPGGAIGWPERCALYVLGAYTVYLGRPDVGSFGSVVEWLSFGVVGVWLVYRLVRSGGRDFTLTPLDLIVVVTTVCLALLSRQAIDDVAFGVIELVVWFYAMELLATRSTRAIWLRALAFLGLGLIMARGAAGMFV